MRTHCAALISAVLLGASGFSCSPNSETGAGDASGAGDGSSSGIAEGGSTTADGGGGPGDAAGHTDAASAGEGSPGGEDASAGDGGLIPDANAVEGSPGGEDAAVGDSGLNDGGGGDGSSEAGAACSVPGTYSIFDGKDLNGWAQPGPPDLWSVVNDVMDAGIPFPVIDGKGSTGGELLVTDVGGATGNGNYGNFRIIVSSHMVATGGTGHLGICFWGGRDPIGQYNNCKLILPPGGTVVGHADYTWDYGPGGAPGGGLNKTTSLGTPVFYPTWNTNEILCWLNGLNHKGFCRVALNGTAVLTYQEQNLSSIQAGPIGVQIHDGTNEEVQYKDICVDPNPTIDTLLTVN